MLRYIVGLQITVALTGVAATQDDAMETLLKEVAAVFGASALFVIVAAWLLKVILIEALKRESQSLVERLKQQGAQELAELKLKLDIEKEKMTQKLDIEKEYMTHLRTEFMAENAIQSLLRRPGWKLRTFDAIKSRLKGFDDDELRKLLVRSGAVTFLRKKDKKELWGLLSLNEKLLTRGQEHEDEEDAQ
jgi:hypothetical protein